MQTTPTIYTEAADKIRVRTGDQADPWPFCIEIGQPVGGWARIHMISRAQLADLRAHIDAALMATVVS